MSILLNSIAESKNSIILIPLHVKLKLGKPADIIYKFHFCVTFNSIDKCLEVLLLLIVFSSPINSSLSKGIILTRRERIC